MSSVFKRIKTEYKRRKGKERTDITDLLEHRKEEIWGLQHHHQQRKML